MRRRTVIAVLVLVAAVLPAVADVPARLAALARDSGQKNPLIRIGLSAAHRVEVSAGSGLRILDPETGKSIWRDRFDGPLQVVAEGGPTGEIERVYRVQVAALDNRESAEKELARLEKLTGAEGVVHHDPDRSYWRVRLGRSDTRLGLTSLTEELRAKGLTDFWISEEPAEAVEGIVLRLVDASYESHPTGVGRVAVVALGKGRVSVDGVSYRGIVELRVSPYGTVRPVNWISLEQYLRGVVPAELGPEVWPELAALRAQAVAARTYAWKNRGQFEAEGFDLCDTPRCQVYKGARAEHPLSDRAISGTKGEVLTWKGDPIVALYTATCGGHTEDGREVFADQDQPYLKGVACRAEKDALESLRGSLDGIEQPSVVDETGTDVTRDWALLQVGGVLEGELAKAENGLSTVTPPELRAMTGGLARLAGLKGPGGVPGATGTLGEAATSLLADLGWDTRAELLVDEADLPALLRDGEASALPLDQRRAIAYLILVDGLRPFADGKLHVDRAPSRARVARAVARVGESYRAFAMKEGLVSGMGQSSVRLVRGKGEARRPVGQTPFLFGRTGDIPVPATALMLWPGDTVGYRLDASGAIDFLELRPPVKGVSDDRTSSVYSWEVRRTRRELEARVNRFVSVGRLKDFEIIKRGVSGRISEMKVIGTAGTAVVRGFDVRRLLDLRESLTVIEWQRDANGEIVAAVFAGKGWGHGVGLCQVGAYGMALRGADYREILTHYYTGAKIEPLVAGR